MGRVVFLDIDGVLITAATCRKGFGIVDPECVATLNELIAQTGAAIVLSSCWRIGRTRIECCDLLQEWGVKGVVLDKTPHPCYSLTRGKEIQMWLDSNERHAVDSFVILDDDSDMDHLMPRLVKTTFESGLRTAHIEKALELLAVAEPPAAKEGK